MADRPQKKKGSLMTFISFAFVFLILFDQNLRRGLGDIVGFVLQPVIGFDHKYPVLTILIAGALMVALTTLVRHFTTDWLTMAKTQAYMRSFQKEFARARKENNTYRIKVLQEKQPEIMAKQQEISTKQMKTMPFTMIIVVPLFAWLFNFLSDLEYTFYTAPWNPHVAMFDNSGILPGLGSLFPHWILLYMCLSIPLGALIQKTMKYLSWKERWKGRHPEVHEG